MQRRSHRFRGACKIQHPLAHNFSYNVSDEVEVTADNPNPPDTEKDQPAEGNEIDEFLQRLPGSFRWPKPNAEAVAAAVEAIHRMSGAAAQDQAAGEADEPGNACSGCGGSLPAGARFCVWCGIPNQAVAGDATVQSRSGGAQHHFHHHYHHLVPGHVPSHRTASGATSAESEPAAPRGRAPDSAGTSSGGRAEASARQVVQDWAQACNTKHIDDLLVLARQPAGTWKILADCWSADLPVGAPAPESAARKGSEPITPLRKPR